MRTWSGQPRSLGPASQAGRGASPCRASKALAATLSCWHLLMGSSQLRTRQLLPRRLWCSNALPLPSASFWRMGLSPSPRPCIPRGNSPLPQPLLLELRVRRRHAQQMLGQNLKCLRFPTFSPTKIAHAPRTCHALAAQFRGAISRPRPQGRHPEPPQTTTLSHIPFATCSDRRAQWALHTPITRTDSILT